MVGKSRLVMVLSYLESIEDPYQYGDNYGDLVEYMKMLLKGEEDYIPEEDGRIGSEKWLNDIKKNAVMREDTGERDFWENRLKDSEFWRYPKFGGDGVSHTAKDQKGKRSPHPKFIEWVKENAVRPEVTDDGRIIADKETFKETGSWGYSNKKNPFNFSLKTLKWIEDNAVEPKRTEYGVIIEDAVDREDCLTEGERWELNERRLEERIDELTKELSEARDEVDLAEEEYAYAKWRKRYKNKEICREVREVIQAVDYHTQIQAILKKLRKQGVHF